jgi:simple sugar transport system ATP-binding protein
MEGYYALKDVTFTARAGEIFGIAGIAGSGQRELLETIAGLYRPEHGDIYYVDPDDDDNEIDLKKKTPAQIRELGVRLSFVPEDRLGMGLVGNMDLTDNVMLRSYGKGHSLFLDRKSPKKVAQNIVEELAVATPSIKTPVRRLSGGNIQKVLVGREIASAPTVFMAAYPVRGLDIGASYTIYNLLNAQKEKGVSVIFVGEDLDVLLALCDRIMVLCDGQVSGIVDARTATKEEIGYMMTSLGDMDKSQNQQKEGENNEQA